MTYTNNPIRQLLTVFEVLEVLEVLGVLEVLEVFEVLVVICYHKDANAKNAASTEYPMFNHHSSALPFP